MNIFYIKSSRVRLMDIDYEYWAGVVLLTICLLFVLLIKLNGPP